MNRRGFLKRTAAATMMTIAAAYCPSVMKDVPETEKQRKERIIAKALSTEEGRKALVMAMTEPLCRCCGVRLPANYKHELETMKLKQKHKPT